MKLKRIRFDRYVGLDETRIFTSDKWDIDLDVPRVGLITITPRAGGEAVITVVHNADMYPEDKPVESRPASPLPAKPRTRQ